MSVESITRALWVVDLSPVEKLVLIGIANHDGDGGAWPSVATLSVYAGVSVRSVQRAIATLVEKGLVTVDMNAGGMAKTRSDRRPNLYHLHLDGVTPAASRVRNGVTPETNGVTPVTERGDTAMSPEPSMNHPEPSENTAAVAVAPAAEPTIGQRANAITRGYWDWYSAKHGTKPINNFNAFRGIVTKALNAGHEDVAVKHALVALHDKGVPLSGESLDRELTRPDASWRQKKTTGFDGLGLPPDMVAALRAQPTMTQAEARAFAEAHERKELNR